MRGAMAILLPLLLPLRLGASPGGTFLAPSNQTSQLYVGCSRTTIAHHLHVRLPDFVVIGVQKGGTTSVIQDLNAAQPQVACMAWGELHFFDRNEFSNISITAHDVEAYAQRLSSKTRCQQSTVALAEKTPAYYYSPHAPLRLCEALGSPRLVIFLRDPTSRAYSSFYEGGDVTHLGRNANGFHRLVEIEVAIIRGCPDSAQPSGDPAIDHERSAHFRECCSALVGSSFGQGSWLGCSCDLSDFHCSIYGDKRAAQVRMGLYIWHLRRIYRYHRASNVLLVRAEDFFVHGADTLKEMLAWATPNRANTIYHVQIPTEHAGSKTTLHEHMLPVTERLLREFYAPFNADLEELVGRKMHWPVPPPAPPPAPPPPVPPATPPLAPLPPVPKGHS
ncbi:unnamed protein product [Pelagomonas calceolata]|uniref:Sulfotransferase domain-containing protein n=1 Tax=Pelagomonas calceolata TaxID=35677 RepID=A0A8J2WL58_9STRA|nr:unnamed protein product [Pelagomonas calceolata]